MIANLLSSLICELFEDHFKLKSAGPFPHTAGIYGKEWHGKGMWMGFRHPKDSDSLFMALYAPSNYVGVYAAWASSFSKLEDIPSRWWRLASYHDSCWRSDGVESIIHGVHELRCSVFDGMHNVRIDVFPQSVLQTFRELVHQRDDGGPRARVTREFLLGRER